MIKQIIVPPTDDDIYGVQEKTFDLAEQFVLFRLGSEWYAIKMQCVREITEVPVVTQFPSLPHSVIGITHLRGNILSVTDLKRLFRLPDTAQTKQSRLVVIQSQSLETALLVDEVAEIITIPVATLEPPLMTLSAKEAHSIEHTVSWKNQLIAILNVEKLFLTHQEAA